MDLNYCVVSHYRDGEGSRITAGIGHIATAHFWVLYNLQYFKELKLDCVVILPMLSVSIIYIYILYNMRICVFKKSQH